MTESPSAEGGPPPEGRPPVLVIGGGFAGLAAATALAEAGVPVRVFEARPTLGGRANTFRDPVTGERIDNGQHVLAGCYTETLQFLRRIGTVDRLHWPSTLRLPMVDERGRRTELALPPLPPPLNLAAALVAWDALDAADRWSVVRMGRTLGDAHAVQSTETVAHWLARHGQSARLCRLLWEPLTLAALNQSMDQAAASVFVAVASRMFASGQDGATLLLPAVPLDQLYAQPAEQYLRQRQCTVQTSTKATITRLDDDRVEVTAGGDLLEASHVISAVPWFALPETLPSPPDACRAVVTNAQQMRSSPIVTVNLWFDREVCADPMLGLPARTFQWAFSRRHLIGSSQSHVSLVCSGAEQIVHTANPDVIAMAQADLCSAIPTAAGHVRHAMVIRERRATFSLAPGSPPRPSTRTGVARLVLAGDWVDTGLPATIESAVLSGHAAARAVLAML